jgi:hypothetical protein
MCVFQRGVSDESSFGSYGKRIRPVDDLTGNFSRDLSSVVLWGDGDASGCVDKLQWYDDGNDAIPVLMRPFDAADYACPTGKKSGDFETIPCAGSTFRLSDGCCLWDGRRMKEKDFPGLLNRNE